MDFRGWKFDLRSKHLPILRSLSNSGDVPRSGRLVAMQAAVLVQSPPSDPVDAALEAKRRAIISAISAARLAHAESQVQGEERRQRKVLAEDLFGSTAETVQTEKREDVKDKSYRMQGEYGAKKFIKP